MTTRANDMIEEQRYYELEHEIKDLLKDFNILKKLVDEDHVQLPLLQKDIDNLKQRVDEDHANLKLLIKDLADTQSKMNDSVANQSIAITRLESSSSTIASILQWGIPICVTVIIAIVGGMWASITDLDKAQYSTELQILQNLNDKVDTTKK